MSCWSFLLNAALFALAIPLGCSDVQSGTAKDAIMEQIRTASGDSRDEELLRMQNSDLEGDGTVDESADVASDFYGFATPRLYFEHMLTFHCEGGNFKQYEAHINAGIGIDAQNKDDGETCLIKAARTGQLEIVKDALKSHNASLNAASFDNTTALLAACEGRQLEVVKLLLKASGKKVKIPRKKGSKRNLKLEKRRLRRPKIQFKATDVDRVTPVMAALRSHDPDDFEVTVALVDALRTAGSPNLSVKDADGLAPAHVAVLNDVVDVVPVLASGGSHLNVRVGRPESAADSAATVDSKPGKLSKFELRRQKDLKRMVKRGMTPLLLALEKRRTAIVDYLLFHANEDSAVAATKLSEQVQSSSDAAAVSQAQCLVHDVQDDEHGADFSPVDVSLADSAGVTPLMIAAVNGNATVVRQLLRMGANPNARGLNSGDTALLRAAFFGELSHLFCCAPVPMVVTHPPSLCTHVGHVDTVRELLEAGALVNQADAQETSPLMKASWYNRLEVVKLLLENGAVSSIHRRSVHGDTALSKAKEWGHNEVVQLLQAAKDEFDATDPLAHRRQRQANVAQPSGSPVQESSAPQHNEL